MDNGTIETWENEGGSVSPLDFRAIQNEVKAESTHMDTLSAMIAWENGNISEGEAIHLFQALVDSGLAWVLQGCYGRQAMRFINAGLIQPKQ